MKPLYLVHQFFPKHYTGTERLTLDLSLQMQRMGHSPTVVTYEPDPGMEGFEKLTDKILVKSYSYGTIPVLALKHSSPVDVSSVFHRTIEEAFQKLRLDYDLVHMCHPMWLSSIATASKDLGIPLVMTLTDSWLLCPRALLDSGFKLCNGPEAGEKCIRVCRLRLKSRYEEAMTLFYKADEITAASIFLANLFRSNGWKRKVRIIPHSIDYRYVKSTNISSQDRIVLGFIGSIAWHKGVHVLVKAIRDLPCKNIALKIYGSPGDQSDYFRAVVDLAGKDERIQFLDSFEISMLPEIMRDKSAMVIPSTYYENYPLVMLISMAYKVPAIVSNIGGMPELIRDGFNGFLFEMGDYIELANIMERIVREPTVLNELKANIVTPRRTEEEALDYENIYRRLVDGR